MEEKKQADDNIKIGIGSILPFMTVVVIVFGLIKQYFYYNSFNLPIKYFFSISEIGLIISGDLLVIIPLIVFYYVLLLAFTKYFKFTAIQSVKKKFSLQTFIFHISIFIILVIFAFSFTGYEIIFLLILMSFFSYLLLQFGLKSDIDITNLKKYNIQSFISLTTIVFMILSFQTYTEIGAIKHGKYNGTKIYFTADSIPHTSTDSSYFIGKTENYVFIYNHFDTTVTIIPTEDVKKIVLKSK